jgi:hypothetical protein
LAAVVAIDLMFKVVSGTVQFDHKASCGAVEVDDEVADWSLPTELPPIELSTLDQLPEPHLRERHVLPQVASQSCLERPWSAHLCRIESSRRP